MVSEEEEKKNKIRYDEYGKYVDKCEEYKNKNIELLDKIVLTISTALFGIIITSLDKIMLLISSIIYLKYLFSALIVCNTFTMIFVVVSIYYANKGLDISIDKAEVKYFKPKEFQEQEDKYTKWARNFIRGYIILISIVIIFCAIILLSILFSKDDKMKKNEELSISMESLTAPKFRVFPGDINKQSQAENTNNNTTIDGNNLNRVNTQQENNQAQASNIKEDKDN